MATGLGLQAAELVVCIHVSVCVCVCVYAHVCMCMCMCLCVCVCVSVSVCVCMLMYMCTCVQRDGSKRARGARAVQTAAGARLQGQAGVHAAGQEDQRCQAGKGAFVNYTDIISLHSSCNTFVRIL